MSDAGAPYGAVPGDWAHFVRLGLEDDLLPVVSDPTATIDPKSKLQGLGKTPSRYNQAGLVVGIPKWTSHVTTDKDIARWVRDSRLGICVQTRVVRAIDIDIEDPAASAAVREFIELGAGSMPLRRRSGTGKCLLMFRMPGDFTKRVLRTAHGAIEFLANGQQFVAIGTHPKGMRYEWVRPTGELGLPEDIPDLSPAEFEVLWSALVQAFGLPDGERRERRGLVPTKPRLAGDLRDPTVAWLDENGWLLEVTREGRADICCPFEHEHTTESGPSSTSYFPAGVGGFARGHFRCLHAHCAGRTDGDFVEALGLVADEFDVVEGVAKATGHTVVPTDQPLPPFARNTRGVPLPTLGNLVLALRRPDICGFEVAYDEFRDLPMVAPSGGLSWRPMTDSDYVDMRLRLERNGLGGIGREMIRDAVVLLLQENSMDTAKAWAESLQWDGVERIDTFWPVYFGVENTPYTRAVGAYTWTALAGRCLVPGIKADMVPVLIGMQGAGKTSSIEALCPIEESFVEVNLQERDTDLARSLRGKLVGEIAELRGLQSRDAESIKAWVSRRFEEWVPKYKEFATRFGRRLLLIGTANNREFLDDETGERRWLPMTTGKVDVAGVRAVRDQLWAEGVVRFVSGGIEWAEAQRLAEAEHGAYKVSDPWHEVIAGWLERDGMDVAGEGHRRGDGLVRMHDVLVSALGMVPANFGRKDELRAGKVLRGLGYEKVVARVDGVCARVWRRSAA